MSVKSIRRQLLEALEAIRSRLRQLGMSAVETTSSLDGIETLLEAQAASIRDLQDAAAKSADADTVLSDQLQRINANIGETRRLILERADRIEKRVQSIDAEVGSLVSLVRNQSTVLSDRVSRIEASVKALREAADGATIVPVGE